MYSGVVVLNCNSCNCSGVPNTPEFVRKENTGNCVARFIFQCRKPTSLIHAATSTIPTTSWCNNWQHVCLVKMKNAFYVLAWEIFTSSQLIYEKFSFAVTRVTAKPQNTVETWMCFDPCALSWWWANANLGNNWHENCTSQLDCYWNCTSAPILAQLTSPSVT